MGSCCSSSQSVEEKESNIQKKRQLPKMKNSKKSGEKETFYSIINSIIEKYKSYAPTIEIKKFSIVQFWNLIKSFPELKNSNFIIVNLSEDNYFLNILNKIDNVNDIINSSKYQDEIALESLRKYVDLKNLLVISCYDGLKQLDKLVGFFIKNKFRCLIYVFDLDLNELSNGINKYMFDLIESTNILNYPYCIISYNKFKNILSNGYIFFDITSKPFKKDSFINQDEKLNRFYKDFKINLVLEIMNKENNDIKETKKSDKIYTCLKGIKSLDDLIERKNILDKIIGNMLNYLGFVEKEINPLNKTKEISILILFNCDIDNELQIYITFCIIYKVFSLEPQKIKNYMINNCYFIKDVKNYLLNNFSKILNFLEKNYNYLKKETLNENLIKDKYSSEDLIYIKDKFQYYLKKYKKEVDETTFLNGIDLIDKIVTNIISHPKEERYYRIKTSSEALNKYVLSNENSNKILELYGFSLITINEVEYYKINEDININYLKGLNFDFKEVLKKLE